MKKTLLDWLKRLFEAYDSDDPTWWEILRDLMPQIYRVSLHFFKISRNINDDIVNECYVKCYEAMIKSFKKTQSFNSKKKTLLFCVIYSVRKIHLEDRDWEKWWGIKLPRKMWSDHKNKKNTVRNFYWDIYTIYDSKESKTVEQEYLAQHIAIIMASCLSITEQIVINSIYFIGIKNELKLVRTINSSDHIRAMFTDKLTRFRIKNIKIKALSKLKVFLDASDLDSFTGGIHHHPDPSLTDESF